MRKCLLTVTVLVALVATTGSAMAESIKGKHGVTARGGFLIPADSKLDVGEKLEADTGFAAGVGVIYGITDNLAAEVDVTYSQYDLYLNSLGVKTKYFEVKTHTISLGAQYRFMPEGRIVPYVGAGMDILINETTDEVSPSLGLPEEKYDTDLSFGGHLSAGADFFLTRQFALTAEFKGILATEAAVKNDNGDRIVKLDPSGISGLFGFRYFF
ncbi:MAG: porin family protein [Geobacter sp.]|nr:porin family protein [Geobacter sp.]